MTQNRIERRGPGDELLIEHHGTVRLVTLNRPASYNATNETLHRELALIWPELDADPEVAAIVLTGAGKAFSGGGDLELLDRMKDDAALRKTVLAEGGDILRGMAAVRVPIVAAINGPAVGLGCSLAATSDIVVMEEHAYLADPHVALGLVAGDGGAIMWPLLTSLLKAKEYLLLGDRLPADEALRIGLANRVADKGTGVTTALEIAARLATLPPQSVRETKALLNQAMTGAIAALVDQALQAESDSFDEPAFRTNLAGMLDRSAKA